MKSFIKGSFNLCGIFLAGLGISTGFVLISNDIFYKNFLRKLFFETNLNKNELWEEIRPRELFGVGAKKVFIKHQISEERDDETRRYHSYVEKQKSAAAGIQDEENKFTQNIYDTNNTHKVFSRIDKKY
jgi:hypothetical protein